MLTMPKDFKHYVAVAGKCRHGNLPAGESIGINWELSKVMDLADVIP